MEPTTPEVEPSPPADFVTTWQQVVSDPRAFFAAMPETGGLGDPMRFLVTCASVNAAGAYLVSWSLPVAIGAFLGVVVGSFLLAAVLTLASQQLFEGSAGFEPVFRAVAYGSAPAVAFWVPWLAAIPCVYAWYLHTRGIERVQGFEPTRAVLTTIIGWAAVWALAHGLTGSVGWIGTR
jgi:hypothetical protein